MKQVIRFSQSWVDRRVKKMEPAPRDERELTQYRNRVMTDYASMVFGVDQYHYFKTNGFILRRFRYSETHTPMA